MQTVKVDEGKEEMARAETPYQRHIKACMARKRGKGEEAVAKLTDCAAEWSRKHGGRKRKGK